MPLALKYRIRQRTGYRTRISFSCLWRQPEVCEQVRRSLARIQGVEDVQVRWRSGSVILVHPHGPVDLARLFADIQATIARLTTAPPRGTRMECGCLAAPSRRQDVHSHISGAALLFSGLYLLYLYGKRVLLALVPATAGPVRILTLPALVAFAISLPIQRQAVDNFRRSGRPDMGLDFYGDPLFFFALYREYPCGADRLLAFQSLQLARGSAFVFGPARRCGICFPVTCQTGLASSRWPRSWRSRPPTFSQGDVIILRKGNAIPGRWSRFCPEQALVDEAALTGEDAPVSA